MLNLLLDVVLLQERGWGPGGEVLDEVNAPAAEVGNA